MNNNPVTYPHDEKPTTNRLSHDITAVPLVSRSHSSECLFRPGSSGSSCDRQSYLRVSQKAGNLLTSWVTTSLLERTLLYAGILYNSRYKKIYVSKHRGKIRRQCKSSPIQNWEIDLSQPFPHHIHEMSKLKKKKRYCLWLALNKCSIRNSTLNIPTGGFNFLQSLQAYPEQ